MKKILYFLTIACAAIFAASCAKEKAAEGPKVEKHTYLYAIKGDDSLYVDRYSKADTAQQPALIFVFGGGFKGGSRSNQEYMPFFNFMAERGYQVISIDYRTMLSRISPDSLKTPIGFVGALQCAIDTAVVDLYDATAFVLNNTAIWGIDKDRIAACGSSAGAITVLQGEFYRANGLPIAKRLPGTFNYAGIISCSGAIASPTAPAWKHNPCPIMLFHGDADNVVPYKEAAIPGVAGLWGSATIADELKGQRASYSFTTIENAAHEVAVDAFVDYPYVMEQFLQTQAFGGKELQATSTISDIHAKEKNKEFGLGDYIKSNM
ncbi:MAG: carboxylesterase family protein [Clostridium sp.]|nr:carboxylesterase family protein [Clostridium sp.]